jgi:hypothetical protein
MRRQSLKKGDCGRIPRNGNVGDPKGRGLGLGRKNRWGNYENVKWQK